MGRVWRLFSFFGRATRREYWAVTVPFNVVLATAVWVVASRGEVQLGGVWTSLLVVLFAGLIVNAALGVRRLHDRGRSGWWLVAYYALPVAVTEWLGLTQGANDVVTGLLALGIVAIFVWTLVDLGMLPGTVGTNRFGADPRGRVELKVFD